MAEWALIKNNVVKNIIVVQDGDTQFAQALVNQSNGRYDRTLDTSTLSGKVGVEWVYKQGRGYIPPDELVAVPAKIIGNGIAASTVTYTDYRPGAVGSVSFFVNDLEQVITLQNGSASIDVVSNTPGDLVDISCGNAFLSVEVT